MAEANITNNRDTITRETIGTLGRNDPVQMKKLAHHAGYVLTVHQYLDKILELTHLIENR